MSPAAARTTFILLLATSIGCTKATSAGEEGTGVAPPPRGDVSVELSGVTLGEDCGVGWTPPPPANRPARRAAPASPAVIATPSEAPADCAPGEDCGGGHYYRQCNQTSIQLALHATGTSAPTPIRIKKVELLDAKGRSLGELTAKNPTRWTDPGSYQPWDQTLAPGEPAAVSYVLTNPNWQAMEGGLYGQTGKMYEVRVTVLAGAKDRVVVKEGDPGCHHAAARSDVRTPRPAAGLDLGHYARALRGRTMRSRSEPRSHEGHEPEGLFGFADRACARAGRVPESEPPRTPRRGIGFGRRARSGTLSFCLAFLAFLAAQYLARAPAHP